MGDGLPPHLNSILTLPQSVKEMITGAIFIA